MKLIADSAAAWDLKFKVWNFMEQNPLFKKSHETLSLDEQRRLAQMRVFTIFNENIYGIQNYLETPELGPKYATAIGSFDPSVSVKQGIGFGMFPSVIQNIGTERVANLVTDNMQMKNFGCFALTGE